MKKILVIILLSFITVACEHRSFVKTADSSSCDQVFFAFDSAVLSEAAKETLERQAEWLDKYPNFHLEVLGYCDIKGTAHYNYLLGKRRAKAVADFLMEKGVHRDRIKIISKGSSEDVKGEYNEKTAAYDRRVDTILVEDDI